ncbi:glycosyltransferase [Arenibacter latericius]|uniref:glycosyltransferase n=1 Tax=Arenibacter latericius TaxID=86104 RepID=UPI0004799D30|nr:glycosyltransferase [Arenibacter latericius]
MLKILYISSLCSENTLQYIYDTSINKPEQAAQKFHRLLAQGLSMHGRKCEVETLSSPPVVPNNHNRKLWRLPNETINTLKYNYVPFINLPFIKNIGVFIYTFFRVLYLTSFFNKGKKTIICDVLNFTVSFSSLLASKITGVTAIAVVTDLPGLMVTEKTNDNSKKSVYTTILTRMIQGFDRYILLTEQMNPIVNPKGKPYIIMEGLVNVEMEKTENKLTHKNRYKTLIYAGGLYAKYGVKSLIEAFMLLDNEEIELHLYGAGELTSEMHTYTNKDHRIIFKGMVPNKIVVQDQLTATLLLNPRPTNEEFTKFSFPSKNMEYMASGTPMITTLLPGMPKEYHPYVYLFETESVIGMKNTLKEVLSKSEDELHRFGQEAKTFVLSNKNNYIQANRIIDFINTNKPL